MRGSYTIVHMPTTVHVYTNLYSLACFPMAVMPLKMTRMARLTLPSFMRIMYLGVGYMKGEKYFYNLWLDTCFEEYCITKRSCNLSSQRKSQSHDSRRSLSTTASEKKTSSWSKKKKMRCVNTFGVWVIFTIRGKGCIEKEMLTAVYVYMCVYVCVCMYVCMYICMFVYIYI